MIGTVEFRRGVARPRGERRGRPYAVFILLSFAAIEPTQHKSMIKKTTPWSIMAL
jgi:hypothetical protein